jgi:hypothetical protein
LGARARSEAIRAAAAATPGFLSAEEGSCLAAMALRAGRSGLGPLVEIGAYLGRSTLYLASGLVESQAPTRLYSIDHHRGSEEMQPGWPDHDPSLVDGRSGQMDSLPRWREAIGDAGAERVVIGVLGPSAEIAADWGCELSLVFIDGGHGREICWGDYLGWAPHVAPAGLLLFHDVYPDPDDGGRPPYECYVDALGSGAYTEETGAACGTLRVLVRSDANTALVARPPAARSDARSTAAAE